MKKIFVFFALVTLVAASFAQTSISCKGTIRCYWDSYDEEWDYTDCEKNPEESSLFIFNENMTMFKHITTNITSVYYVVGDMETDYNDDGQETISCDVVSDAGNSYSMVICVSGEYIKFISPRNFQYQWGILKVF